MTDDFGRNRYLGSPKPEGPPAPKLLIPGLGLIAGLGEAAQAGFLFGGEQILLRLDPSEKSLLTFVRAAEMTNQHYVDGEPTVRAGQAGGTQARFDLARTAVVRMQEPHAGELEKNDQAGPVRKGPVPGRPDGAGCFLQSEMSH
jgi:hypothetical protein